MFLKIVVPQNGWFIRETPVKMDDLGVPLFLETPIYCHSCSGSPFNHCRVLFFTAPSNRSKVELLDILEVPTLLVQASDNSHPAMDVQLRMGPTCYAFPSWLSLGFPHIYIYIYKSICVNLVLVIFGGNASVLPLGKVLLLN